MKVRIRCKRASARRYQKNRNRMMYVVLKPCMSLPQLGVSDLHFTMYTEPLSPARSMMMGSHCPLNSIMNEVLGKE